MGKKIAVIGQGFVGGSLATVFAERGFNVNVYDKMGKRAVGCYTLGATSVKDLLHKLQSEPIHADFSGVVFVCLPTPMKPSGEADVSIVESVLAEIADCHVSGKQLVAVVKSTVPPGSVKKWNRMFNPKGLWIVFNPEFLREASAVDDMRNQDRVILGGPKVAVNIVRDVFRQAWPDVPIHKTSSTNAEFVKYVINAFLAMKVSFANEIYQMCETFDPEEVDYDRVVDLATLDKRLGTSHWKVPGTMPADDGSGKLLRGFAGSCFCKDVNALIHVAKELGIDPKMLNATWQKNLEVRPERDWERLIGRAVSDPNDKKS